MESKITLQGKIVFEPENRTKKHNSQSSWKRMAMVNFSGDITEYYAWFIQRRYNLVLNKPLRGSHISFINDSMKELSCNDTKTAEEIDSSWELVKNKWDKQIIPVVLDLDVKFGKQHWWLQVPQEDRELLHGIRSELGLGRPYWGLHMTIGHANEKNIEHSDYIQRLIQKGFII